METILALTCARCMRDQLMVRAYHIRLASGRSALVRHRCGLPCPPCLPALARHGRDVVSSSSRIATYTVQRSAPACRQGRTRLGHSTLERPFVMLCMNGRTGHRQRTNDRSSRVDTMLRYPRRERRPWQSARPREAPALVASGQGRCHSTPLVVSRASGSAASGSGAAASGAAGSRGCTACRAVLMARARREDGMR